MSVASSVPFTVLVDMDGTVADIDAWLRKLLKERHGIDLGEREEFEHSGEMEKLARAIMSEPGFYLNLPVIEGAVQALNEMKDSGYEVLFCTSPLNQYRYCLPEKFEWVERHFGPEWVRQIIITKDKSRVRGDLLIDDCPTPKAKIQPLWAHVVFTQSYNRKGNYAYRLDRWQDWKGVITGAVTKMLACPE